MPENSEYIRFQELLPFFVNGTLVGEELQFMQAYMAAHPEAQKNVEFERVLNQTVRELAENEPVPDIFPRLKESLKGSKGQEPWWARLIDFWGEWGFRSPAFAMMVLVAMIQTGFLFLWRPVGQDSVLQTQYRGTESRKIEADIVATVDPKTDMATIIELLRANQCEIVSGPSESGELWLRLEDKMALDKTVNALRQSGNMIDVLPVNSHK